VIPEVRPTRRDLVGYRADHAGVEVRVAPAVIERDDRHAPRALAADAPVGTRFNGATNAGLAPTGYPLYVADRLKRLLAMAGPVERNEPLVDRAEDDRRLRTPAVRVAVGVALLRQQRAGGIELLEHGDVRRRRPLLLEVLDSLERVQSHEIRRHASVVDVATIVSNRAIRLEPVLNASQIVLRAM